MAVMPVNYYEGNPNVKIVGYVYETDDYDMFKKMDGNRNVEKIGKLKTSMRKNGFMNCPVLINENGEVSDGQNRIESAKELNIPVKFVVQSGIRLSHTVALNTGQKNWSAKNFLHSYSLWDPDCDRFERLVNMCPYGDAVAYAATGANITGSGATTKMKAGTIKCNEKQYEFGVRMIKWLNGFDDLVKSNHMTGNKKNFYLALVFAAWDDQVDIQVLTQRVRDNFHVYGTRFGTLEDVIKDTEKVYNFKVPMGNRVYLTTKYREAVDKAKARGKFSKEGGNK